MAGQVKDMIYGSMTFLMCIQGFDFFVPSHLSYLMLRVVKVLLFFNLPLILQGQRVL